MRELMRKKSVRGAILIIVILVAIGIAGINVQSVQRRQEYNEHIDAAEKYLSELDYEQAIAEYTLALEIEPNAQKVQDGLEKAYLAYGQAFADAGDYERAIAIWKEGYEKTGRESLKVKIEEEENKVIEFSEISSINLMGYDLHDDHFEELCEKMRLSVEGGSETDEYGGSWAVNEYDDSYKRLIISKDIYSIEYEIDVKNRKTSLRMGFPIGEERTVFTENILGYTGNFPVSPGDTYEDWRRVMQIDKIREKGEKTEYEGGAQYSFKGEGGRGVYIWYEDMRFESITFWDEEGNLQWGAEVNILPNGVIYDICYENFS